jgi:nicotinamide-nucleotide amidase
MNCTIITIGDELLIGQVIDTNSAFIAQRMNEIGIAIERRIAISDSLSAIQQTIIEAWKTAPILIVTGGLGPTKDDITKKALAELFQVGFKRDEPTYLHVKSFFESRKAPFLPVNEAQADIPENAEVLFNARGTAPGMWFDIDGKILISMPGVPYEMEYLMQTYVIEKLQSRFNLPALYYAYIQTCGLGESFLAKKISHIEDGLSAGIGLAYLPSPMAVNLRLSGQTKDEREIDLAAAAIQSELSDYVYGTSKKPIEELVYHRLKETNQTITLVESCTGGYISNLLTNISGSSDVYIGGWNVYTNQFKTKQLNILEATIREYSAVSEECARELLEKALDKTSANYGIAVVGYLEKYEANKAHAYIAYGSCLDIRIKKVDLFQPRVKAKEAIARVALVSLYKEFLNNPSFQK